MRADQVVKRCQIVIEAEDAGDDFTDLALLPRREIAGAGDSELILLPTHIKADDLSVAELVDAAQDTIGVAERRETAPAMTEHHRPIAEIRRRSDAEASHAGLSLTNLRASSRLSK